MKEFNYLHLHTTYSCTGDLTFDATGAACFSRVFGFVSNRKKFSIYYKIRIYTDLKAATKKNYDNCCLLNIKEIKNFIKQAREFIPFDFKVIRTKEGDLDAVDVYLKVYKLKGIYHKYILSWVRYLYEFPYNMYVIEANKLRKENLFRFESIANLINLIGSCIYLGGGHTIGYGNSIGLLRRKEMFATIGKHSSLNDIYPSHYKEKKYTPTIVDFKGIEISFRDLEYWQEEELYQNRLEVYKRKYKDIKKLKL